MYFLALSQAPPEFDDEIARTPPATSEPTAVLSLGETEAHLAVVHDGLRFARTIRAGGANIDRALARKYELEPGKAKHAKETEARIIGAGDHGSEDARAISTAVTDGLGAILRAVWAEERNIADEATLVAIADEQGMDGTALLAAAKTDAIAAAYAANTAEAMERNVFGAPTYIIDGENFWGQDRLDFVERALA